MKLRKQQEMNETKFNLLVQSLIIIIQIEAETSRCIENYKQKNITLSLI